MFDWYAKESGLVLITTVKPTGTFTFVPKAERTYTLAEVTDILNEALLKKDFILIRRKMTFYLQPADEKLDGSLVRRVTLDELAEWGNTELVQVVLPVKNIDLDADLVAELKKLLTPFGTIVPLPKSNALLIADTAGNVRRIRDALERP